MKQLEMLRHQLRGEQVHARDVAARPVEAGDETKCLTGSPPVAKTIGIVVVAALAADAAVPPADDHHLTANQASRKSRQTIDLIFRLAIFDRDVLALDIAGFLQALAECRNERRPCAG